ncbi:MAG: bifunctional UDP-N-acetylglucosamine diphosphorylase/glucosamine-1-phosphate N-acetyltransferase GlmU [Pseudomonadota bacterium]
MSDIGLLTIVLAAGKGTRMKSNMPKVLHKIAGQSMLGHVLSLANARSEAKTAVVVGPDMDDVQNEVRKISPGSDVFVQHRQQGTADAVLAAREALEGHTGDVLVLYADTPLIKAETLEKLAGELRNGAGVAVLGFEAANPTGYGRLLTNDKGELLAIREEKDASETERKVRLCNSGVVAFGVDNLLSVLDRIGNDNANGEYYLTDAIEVARADGQSARVVQCSEDEVLGVNTRVQLAEAEAIWQTRTRKSAMLSGVTMLAPETVTLAFDTAIGPDVIIEPNVFFGPGVSIEADVTIKANCHLEGIDAKSNKGVVVKSGSVIGPFARLRPGAHLSDDVHIGNFVEVKNATLGQGAKANHLSYVGDATIGEDCNIGAGTIFCNYDGFDKARSALGNGVFIGSNSAIVAPVDIGEGAYVAAGSTITKDVAKDALAIERAPQSQRNGWAANFRAAKSSGKG